MFLPGMLRQPVNTNDAAMHANIKRDLFIAVLFSILPTCNNWDLQINDILYVDSYNPRHESIISIATARPPSAHVKKPKRPLSMSALEDQKKIVFHSVF